MFPDAKKLEYWTAEDCISLDKIPYIGEFSNVMDNVYVATGFNKWGMTSANISANIIKNEILNMMKDSSEGIIAKRLKTKKNSNLYTFRM